MENSIEIQLIIDMMIKDRNIRRKLASEKLSLFFGTYFSHYIKYQFAPFHSEMFQLAEDENNKTIVIMGARNSAKSAIMNTALAIWSVLGVQKKHLVVIVSRTEQKAKQHFLNIRKELETNKLLKSDRGPLKTAEARWGPVLELEKYDAYITFASAEQDIRGIRYKQYRPDLIIADDIEDSASVKTIDGRNQTYDWLVRDTIPASDLERLRIVLLGTLLHEDSIMMRFKNDIMTKKRDGVYREYPLMDAAGNILWKGKYPDMVAVEAERMRVGNDKAWAQEFLLRIVSDHERVIHREWIHYAECPEMNVTNKYRGTYISIDPAISEEEKSDCTAMIVARVFGWGKDLKIYILPYPVNEHIGLPTILDRAKTLVNQHVGAKIYVEDVAFQKGLIQILKDQGYSVFGIRPHGDKRERLALISHLIKNGTILFAPRGNEELVMQIVNFGSERYMDLADALSMVIPELVTSQQGYRPFPDTFATRNANPEKGEEPDEVPDNYRPPLYSEFFGSHRTRF